MIRDQIANLGCLFCEFFVSDLVAGQPVANLDLENDHLVTLHEPDEGLKVIK